MAMIDFSRGELSPSMRYRPDLEAYHKGLELFRNALADPKGGYRRRPGSQVLQILPWIEAPSALETFNLGASGLASDIGAPSHLPIITIESTEYDTKNRVADIPANTEIQILLVFTESDDIKAYWINTPSKIPAYIGHIWNLVSGAYERPSLGFDDTRDVRVCQVQSNVYVVSRSSIFKIKWDTSKVADLSTALDWDSAHGTYELRDTVRYIVGDDTYYFECNNEHTSGAGFSPGSAGGYNYWDITYQPFLSWEKVDMRVARELLSGAGIDDDPYEWHENTAFGTSTLFLKGQVVLDSLKYYECVDDYTTASDAVFATDLNANKWVLLPEINEVATDDFLKYETQKYKRSTFLYAAEDTPRSIVTNQNRMILAGSSSRPSTIFGSEVAHYENFGAGLNDDEPWTFTLSGDRMGRILWLTVTDQLYIGTSGGLYAVSDVITPNQFKLRKVTSHAASIIEGCAVSGNMVFFQSDRRTLREVAYSDQAQNYQAQDLTVFSDHLFKTYRAVKMCVMHNPTTTLWILREDGKIISLTYDNTVGMFSFAEHEFDGKVIDISAGTGDDLYAIVDHENQNYREILRIGDITLTDTNSPVPYTGFSLDGLHTMVNTDTHEQFLRDIPSDAFVAIMEADGINTVSDMRARTLAYDVSSAGLTAPLVDLKLNYFENVIELDLSDNALTDTVPYLLSDCAELVTLDLSGNTLNRWDLSMLPAKLKNIDLSNNSFPPSQLKNILIACKAQLDAGIIDGILNLSDMGVIEIGMGLSEAASLDAGGWTVVIDNAGEAPWTFDVTFSANGGTGTAPDAQAVAIGGTITIPANPWTYAGKRFVGWSLTTDGVGELLEGAIIIKDTEAAMTFYAIWEVVSSIVYRRFGELSSGSVPVDSATYADGEPVTVLGFTDLAKTGYTLTAWNTASDGSGTDYLPGSTITMDTDGIILYTKWVPIVYTITFDGNGKTNGTLPVSFTAAYDSTITIPSATLKKEIGYEAFFFKAWNSAANASGIEFDNDGTATWKVTGDITLYATWRDFQVGDTGPGGGVVFYDFGSYAERGIAEQTINYGSVVLYSTYHSFRYIEVTKTDQGSGKWSEGKIFTIGGYSDWRLPNAFGIGLGVGSTNFGSFFGIMYGKRVAIGIENSFNSDKYWCREWQNIWWNPNGYRINIPSLSTSYKDSNNDYRGYRPMRMF